MKLLSFIILFAAFGLAAAKDQAQPSRDLSGKALISCADLSNIVSESYNGFRNFRYNERLNSSNTNIYSTTLPNLGFKNAIIQISKAPLFNENTINAAHYQAFSVFKTLDEAKLLTNLVKESMKTCASDALTSNKTPNGFLEQIKYLIPAKSMKSEITATLSLFKGTDSQFYVILQIVSSLSTPEKGVMQNPPVNSAAPTGEIPSQTINVCQFIKILSDSAKDDLRALILEEIPLTSDDNGFDKKFRAKIQFSQFGNPEIKTDQLEKLNGYYSVMSFKNNFGSGFVLKQTVERLNECNKFYKDLNLNFAFKGGDEKVYYYKIDNQTHPNGLKYYYYVALQDFCYRGDCKLYFKFLQYLKK